MGKVYTHFQTKTVQKPYPLGWHIPIYKTTKIALARSDWPRDMFAWEHVNMVVTSRCFVFHALISQARIWKSFSVQSLTSLLYLPIPLWVETWKIITKHALSILFLVNWHFKQEKSIFWKASFFVKQRIDIKYMQHFMHKTLWLIRISILISAITKSFSLRLFSGLS